MIAKAIYSLLSTDPELANVDVSPMWSDTTRACPMITYLVEDDYQATKVATNAVRSEVTVLVISDNYLEMDTIASQVVTRLDKFKGTQAGVNVRSIDIQDAEESRDKTTGLYAKEIEFVSIWNL